MKPVLDETHDSKVQSWVESANLADADFPLQNLPFGVFRAHSAGARAKVGVAIGDRILDIHAWLGHAYLSDEKLRSAANACASDSLNLLMALGAASRNALRQRVHTSLREDAPAS